MNSREWNQQGWQKVTNPSGEIVRKKSYTRKLLSYINTMPENINDRKRLAKILQVPFEDLLGDLEITVNITKYKRDTREYHRRRYRGYLKWNT